uniref:Uncharacterized protein n=1 Tax=Rhizophora mucronata TaxID=61149 RepID=A0A2P2NTX4_RHIMU
MFCDPRTFSGGKRSEEMNMQNAMTMLTA